MKFEKENQEDFEYEKGDSCNFECTRKYHKEILWMITKTRYHIEYNIITGDGCF